jgi:alkylated DNA repair dioxygenase AlkB
MDLFNEGVTNLLPADGEVIYFGQILSSQEALYYFEQLLHNIQWQHDEALIYGKLIVTKRKAAWYGDENFSYTYSRRTKVALPWTAELKALKSLVESRTGDRFNSCLLNLYHSGEEGMSWHSDDEDCLGVNTTIASLSLGAERLFAFKHRTQGTKVSLMLEHGSLLVMKGETQTHWLHALPKSTKVKRPRINLTFRTIIK